MGPHQDPAGQVLHRREGLNIGKDGAEPVSDDYPGQAPWPFTGGTIQRAGSTSAASLRRPRGRGAHGLPARLNHREHGPEPWRKRRGSRRAHRAGRCESSPRLLVSFWSREPRRSDGAGHRGCCHRRSETRSAQSRSSCESLMLRPSAGLGVERARRPSWVWSWSAWYIVELISPSIAGAGEASKSGARPRGRAGSRSVFRHLLRPGRGLQPVRGCSPRRR